MQARDAINKTNRRDVNESRLNRDSAIHKPDYEPGMGDEDFSDFYNNIDTNSEHNIGMTDFNNVGMNNQNMPLGSMSMFNNEPSYSQQPPKPTQEEVFKKVAIEVLKGIWKFFVTFAKSFKGITARFWTKFGAKMIIVGGALVLFSILLLIFKKSAYYDILVSGILCLITGVVPLTFLYDKAKEDDGVYKTNSNSEEQQYNLGTMAYQNEDDGEEIFLDEDSDEEFYDEYDDENYELIDNLNFDEDLFEVPREVVEAKDMTEVIENLEVPVKGLFTRQFLFDTIYQVLMSITPDFDIFKEIDEESETFDSLNHIVVTAAKQQQSSNDEDTYLIKASENLQFIKLDIKRTKSIKNIQTLCTEIANIFKVDEETGIIPEENEGIYATGLTVGDKIIIKLFKGDGSMVSIKDILFKVKNFFLDASNKMPCILGIDSDGQIVVRDFKDIESMLVTGFPRSGKSWFVLCLVTQLCMWNSPRDVKLLILDPKNKISDFKNFNLPHVKEFITKDDDIVEKLRYLVREEATRRENIIGAVNKVNIWDFKKENPDIDLPIIYVIIDEVITLADRMDSDTKKEFQGYLRELVTRLPAFGIRAILLPHVIKNDIIGKTTTDSIQFRVSVKGDSKHIENNLSIKNFPHLLRRKGDMAVKLPDTEPKFIRAAVLTSDNDKNIELFSFLRKLWIRVEPDCENDSVAKEAEIQEQINKMVKDSTNEIDDFFNQR